MRDGIVTRNSFARARARNTTPRFSRAIYREISAPFRLSSRRCLEFINHAEASFLREHARARARLNKDSSFLHSRRADFARPVEVNYTHVYFTSISMQRRGKNRKNCRRPRHLRSNGPSRSSRKRGRGGEGGAHSIFPAT